MIIETIEYDAAGNRIGSEFSRTRTYAEFQFDYERAELPLIEVREITPWEYHVMTQEVVT